MKFNRILLKLSGEALMGEQLHGICPARLNTYAREIKTALNHGIEIAIIIGGGNIFRGLQGAAKGMDRVQGDYMGMLATVINSLALQAELEKIQVKSTILSGIQVLPVTEPMTRRRAVELLLSGQVVIISGGTGNPFFTTDTAAALRASEIEADVILKGTRVDGVYSADPEKEPNAKKYETITFEEVYQKQLKVMDLTAITLCRENKLPVVVFNMNIEGNLARLLEGKNIGTLVTV
ncbi:MAG: UMP kinase [Lentimicrobium sp.]|jgi:uridylate kinase|nr:UMP kinase [Lentimicrobium sp.]MDD2527959.1 UMP kinase [Lentimicrobiaceae bacterium]MDD4598181.1 UMP kinase [Lentimicrobiaceae bacterium]MDY0026075.1 UMP kinase [Lentimicrobium sp.]